MFRAKQRRQDKAQSAENGESLSRTATLYWRRCLAPCGRVGKRSPAVLRRLARARHYLHGAPGAQPLPDPLNMSISPGKSTRQTGFSLLELAIGLMIIALVLGGMLNPLGSLLERKQRAQAGTELERIREALVGFAMINGYLPCPATATDPDNDTYGLENDACHSDSAAEGYIPWRTLGVPEVDPWGVPRSADTDSFNGYWRYRVDRNFSNSADLISMKTASADNLSVVDNLGRLLTAPTETPVAIIFSTGANLTPDGENTLFEGAPCGNVSGYDAGSGTSCPDGEPLYQGGDVSGAGAIFDDVLVWMSRPRLFNRMVTAGRLP